MMLRTIFILWAFCGFVAGVGAQNLDDIAVEKAIKAGLENKFRQWSAQCTAGASLSQRRKDGMSWNSGSVHFTGAYQVTISTNLGRVALLAAESKQQQKPFGVVDVPERFRREGVHLLVEPIKPGRDWGGGVEVPASIDRVLLRSKTDPTAVVQPEAFETEDVTWDLDRVLVTRAGRGGAWETNVFKKSRATGVFPAQAVKSLPAGDLEIVVITAPRAGARSDAGERVCTIHTSDRFRLVLLDGGDKTRGHDTRNGPPNNPTATRSSRPASSGRRACARRAGRDVPPLE